MAYDDPVGEIVKEISDSATETEDIPLTDFEHILAERYGSAPVEDSAGRSDTVEQPGEGLSSAESPPPEIADKFDLGDGASIDRDTALAYLQFEALLASRPDLQKLIADNIEQQQQEVEPEEEVEPVAPPEEFDPDDPVVKYLMGLQENTQKKLDDALNQLARHDVQLTTQTQATTESIVERASASFAKERSLDEEQMSNLRNLAANLNVMESLLSPVDPITRLPRRVDPLAAVEKALDLAYWSIPEYREKEITRQLNAAREDSDRKRKLSSLGGSSGTTSREAPQPTTKEEIHQAMIREVAEATGVPPSS